MGRYKTKKAVQISGDDQYLNSRFKEAN